MSDETGRDTDGPVVLRTYGNRVEAEIVAGVLRDSGIDAVVRADDLGGTDPALWMVRGVHVLVRPGDRDRADEIVESIRPAEDPSTPTGDAPDSAN